jgi:tetratricopeptide (TPR) repeat protein
MSSELAFIQSDTPTEIITKLYQLRDFRAAAIAIEFFKHINISIDGVEDMDELLVATQIQIGSYTAPETLPISPYLRACIYMMRAEISNLRAALDKLPSSSERRQLIRHFSQSTDPDDYEDKNFHDQIALCLILLGDACNDIPRALHVLKKARSLPGAIIPVTDYLSGICYYNMGDYQTALKNFCRVKKSIHARNYESLCLFEMDKAYEAATMISDYIYTGDPVVLNNYMVFSHRLCGDEVYPVAPTTRRTYRYNIGAMYLNSSFPDKTLELFAEDDSQLNEDEMFLKANALLAIGRIDEATELFRYLIMYDGVTFDIEKLSSGMIRFLDRDYTGALTEWDQLSDVVSRNPCNYAVCLFETGEYARSIDLIHRVSLHSHQYLPYLVCALVRNGQAEDAFRECMQNACSNRILEIVASQSYIEGCFIVAFKAYVMLLSSGNNDFILGVRASSIKVINHTLTTGKAHKDMDHTVKVLRSLGTDFEDIVTVADQWYSEHLM